MAINYNFLKFQKTTYSDFICCLFVYVYHVVFPCSLHFSYLRHYVSIATWDLRAKIEAIITKPGVADEDCPTDAASMRWWCNVGGRYTGRELTSVAMNATANPSQQTPMTPAEEREKFRTWVSFSFYWYLRLL